MTKRELRNLKFTGFNDIRIIRDGRGWRWVSPASSYTPEDDEENEVWTWTINGYRPRHKGEPEEF